MPDPKTPSADRTEDPFTAVLDSADSASIVALAGHPLHAMMVHFPIVLGMATLAADLFFWWGGDPFWARAAVWAIGVAFLAGVAAGLVGLAELLLVRGIRLRGSGWAHGVAAVMLISVLGMNWGLRLTRPEDVLPLGLALSALGAVLIGFAGWHGGKLIYHHGIGLVADEEEEGEAPEDEEDEPVKTTDTPAP
ncbi:DUF2231 domain-containing protein [Frigidibacter mobilis]|uniref:DUF2231 domain-containing protein n=1 Tax=Frigidibacter mobilis TaxID=1335048 RepID=A0A165SM75_9RHOB|nr:DUF2231 domain-containing protein [Frigidibacter mobilis]AMY69363.1 hypothetical protein AKL17_2117 [Frigidibacter mobilis]